MVRFVHAADLHLDATFGGVDATDERVAGALARSTFEALDRIVKLCIDRQVDFLVIAGDLHNSADRSLRAELTFQRAMRRLAEARIGAFVVHGNHDPADGWTAGLELPDSVTVFSAEAVERREVFRDGRVVCAVYGRSYPTRQVTENLARGFKKKPGDPLAVAVLHANVGQREGWDNYAPCTVDDLRASGMNYWALGHIHVPGRVANDPPSVYPGSTQGLDPSEEGPRGCYVVELDGDGAVEDFVETASVRWRRAEIDCSDISEFDELRTALRISCDDLRRDSGGLPAITRIDLTGQSRIHAGLSRIGIPADLLSDLREEQLDLEPWIWVDRLRDRTRPALDLENILIEEGLRGDLARLARDLISDSRRAETTVDEVLAPVVFSLAVRPELDLKPDELISRARDLCLDLLAGEE
jgi:exonuclease SbcD